MTTITTRPRPGAGFHASFLANCGIGGIRVTLEAPDMGAAAEIKAAAANMRNLAEAAQRMQADANRRMQEFEGRLCDAEQKAARRGGGAGPVHGPFDGDATSIGDQVLNSEAHRAFAAAGFRGRQRLEVKATLTSATGSTGGTHGGMVAPDRAGVEPLAQRPLTIRQLCKQSRTESNTVLLMRQSLRNSAAAAAPEATTKNESAYAWDEVSFKISTIAHWVPITRQVYEDAASLRSIVNGELMYGLRDREEKDLLLGNGANDTMLGIMPQAQAYVAPFATPSETPLDRLLKALAQASIGLYKPSAIVLNTSDAFALRAIKDTTGQYVGGGPYAGLENLLWSVPWVSTNLMPQNSFCLGDFANAAEIYDRKDSEILISDSHEDFFVKNILVLLAEQRTGLVVRAPAAFVRGTLVDA